MKLNSFKLSYNIFHSYTFEISDLYDLFIKDHLFHAKNVIIYLIVKIKAFIFLKKATSAKRHHLCQEERFIIDFVPPFYNVETMLKNTC